MNKLFGLVALLSVVLFFFIVSVAGENSRVDSVVDELIINLNSEEFSSQCIKVIVINNLDSNSNCDQDMFIFTLSLLKRFELLGTKNYYINIKRKNYWFPFILNQGIIISLNLSKSEHSSFNKWSNNIDYVEDLFTIKRTGFRWNFDAITIHEPKLVKIFNDTKEQVDFHKFVVQSGSSSHLKEVVIHDREFTEIDRLLLKFSVEQILRRVESPKDGK